MADRNDPFADEDFAPLSDDFLDPTDSDFAASDFAAEAPAIPEEIDDEFDQLRRKSARGETFDDELAEEDAFSLDEGDAGFSMSNFSSGQRLVLAVLVLLDILMIGFGILVVTGRVG